MAGPATLPTCGLCNSPMILYRSEATDSAGVRVNVAVCAQRDFARCRNKHPVLNRVARVCPVCHLPVGLDVQ